MNLGVFYVAEAGKDNRIMPMMKLRNHIMQLRKPRTQELGDWLRLEPRGFSIIPCFLEPF